MLAELPPGACEPSTVIWPALRICNKIEGKLACQSLSIEAGKAHPPQWQCGCPPRRCHLHR
jgi:hypothetical protein